jgi:hypothetical protein
MDSHSQTPIIESIITQLAANYVFPASVPLMGSALRAKLEAGGYAGLAPEAFARALTSDLRSAALDQHLAVRYMDASAPAQNDSAAPPGMEMEAFRRQAALGNFGFALLERLAGNVGYFDLRALHPPDWIADRLAAAFTFLADSSALILDLRENRGGFPEAVTLACSYFLPAQPRTLVNTVYLRPEDRTDEMWTTADLPAPRFLDKPVYVLVSERTFSAGEELAYNLKHLGRARLVGETTRGGAHPARTHRIDAYFTISIPFARSINPITGTNWEGVGVDPHVRTLSTQALRTAHLQALEQLLHGPQVSALEAEWREAAARLKADRVNAGRSSAYSQDRATPLQVIL